MSSALRKASVQYSDEVAFEICQRLAAGESLRSICFSAHMPDESTVRYWALVDYHGFFPKYARAREIQAELIADELLEIADDGSNDWTEREGATTLNGEHVQRSRLRVDTRKWLLSKMLPKKYGDRVDVHNTSNVNVVNRIEIVPVKPEQRDK